MSAVSGKETCRAGYSFSTTTIRILEEFCLSFTEDLLPSKINSRTVKGKKSFPIKEFSRLLFICTRSPINVLQGAEVIKSLHSH
jgi:hypothetical protein